MTARERAEQKIANYHGRKHCFLTGRGTAAICASLDVIHELAGPGEVILPTIGCASLAQAPGLVGFTPVFADIRLDDYTVAVADVAARITPRTRAIMPVHIFGHAAAMDALDAVAKRHGLFIIEDACHGLGGRLGNRKLGAWGDFSVLSFGGTKAINVGGGGAILTDRDDLADRLRPRVASLPPKPNPSRFALLSLSHRNLYHSLVDLLRSDPSLDVSAAFQAASPHFADWLSYRWDGDDETADRLIRSFEELDAANARRLHRAAFYFDHLQNLGLDHPSPRVWQEAGVLWRYSFLAPDSRLCQRFTEHLRKHGIHVSNHYWSLADLTAGNKRFPRSQEFSQRVLNLWVDDTAGDDYLAKSATVFASFARDNAT